MARTMRQSKQLQPEMDAKFDAEYERQRQRVTHLPANTPVEQVL